MRWYNGGMNEDGESFANEPLAPPEGQPVAAPDRTGYDTSVGAAPAPVAAGSALGPSPASVQVVTDVQSDTDWDTAAADDAGVDDGGAAGAGQLPRPLARGCVAAASLTLIVAMIAVAVTGFTGSTWNYSSHRMDRAASQQLANLADAMAAVGAPRAAIVHVRAAAQPGINRGAALEALATAVQILAESGDDPHLVPLRRALHRAYLEIYEKEYGGLPTPERLRPTVPSFEA